MKNSDTTTFHKICSKPYRQISSDFPEIIISLIVHIEETVMKSRSSHIPCSWNFLKFPGNDNFTCSLYRRNRNEKLRRNNIEKNV